MSEYCRCGNPLSKEDIQIDPIDPYCKKCRKIINEILNEE